MIILLFGYLLTGSATALGFVWGRSMFPHLDKEITDVGLPEWVIHLLIILAWPYILFQAAKD